MNSNRNRNNNGYQQINRKNNTSRGRRRGRNCRAPLELRAMAPQMVSGPTNPPPTLYSIKTFFRHALEVSAPTSAPTALFGVTTGLVSQSLPGDAGWASFRLVKVSAYYSAGTGITPTSSSGLFVALQMPSDASYLDDNTQTFTDHGVPGSSGPALHVIPSFAQRERWYTKDNSGTVVLFKTAGGPAINTAVIILLHVTLELKSGDQVPVFLRTSPEL